MAEPKLVLHASPATAPTAPLAMSAGFRQPLVRKQQKMSTRAQFPELAGETMAECAAICCCCPCGLLDILLLLTVKLPKGLFLQGLRRLRKRLGKKRKTAAAIPGSRRSVGFSFAHEDEDDLVVLRRQGPVLTRCSGKDAVWLWQAPSPEFYEAEKELLAKFCAAAGFGRSPSERENELASR